MNLILGWNEYENSHNHNNNHRAPKLIIKANNQTRITTVFCAPERSLIYRFLFLDEVKARHRLRNQQAQLQKLRLVNLTGNAQSDTFKALSSCFEHAPYTALTIV